MATYVILHGATSGGWAIRPLAQRLRKAGHEVFTPTYTGLGERSHLLNREIGLDTHTQDVLNVFHYEHLSEVILVGISYSGMIITAVAEAIPERIAHLVYVDALVPQDGQSVADLFGPQISAHLDEVVHTHGDGWLFPGNRSIDPRVSDQPIKTFYDRISITNPAAQRLPRTYICCTEKPKTLVNDSLNKIARQAKEAGWRYHELPTDHFPERDMPDELCTLLLELIES